MRLRPQCRARAAAEFAQKLANERRMPFEQRLARAAAQRAAESRAAQDTTARFGHGPGSLSRCGDRLARRSANARPPAPTAGACDRGAYESSNGRDCESATGTGRRSALGSRYLDAARDRVLPAARPAAARIAEQPSRHSRSRNSLLRKSRRHRPEVSRAFWQLVQTDRAAR